METLQNPNEKPMSVKDWLITLLIMAIPIVGIVMLFFYAFGNAENINRQNWAKAQLIMFAIAIAIALLFFVVFGAIFAASMANSN
jgi:cell division protein FtsW (lipid II flippase)